MSSITDYESNQLESLLAEIQQEEETYEALQKELTRCKNSRRYCEMLDSREFTREKLFQVRVLVFRRFADLLIAFPEKVSATEHASLADVDDSNIFLVEVFVTRAFHSQLVPRDLLVNFTLAAGGRSVGKSVALRDRHTDAVAVMLPFAPRRAHDEVVSVWLTSPTTWWRIQLASIHMDVACKFATTDDDVEDNEIMAINRLYDSGAVVRMQLPVFSYKLRCALDGDAFVLALVRRAFASVDPTRVASNEGNRVAEIVINDQRVRLELDAGKKCLRIAAPADELCQLKRYFTTALDDVGGATRKWLKQDFQPIQQSLNVLKEARTKLTAALQCEQRVDVQNLLSVYDLYARFVDGCPL